MSLFIKDKHHHWTHWIFTPFFRSDQQPGGNKLKVLCYTSRIIFYWKSTVSTVKVQSLTSKIELMFWHCIHHWSFYCSSNNRAFKGSWYNNNILGYSCSNCVEPVTFYLQYLFLSETETYLVFSRASQRIHEAWWLIKHTEPWCKGYSKTLIVHKSAFNKALVCTLWCCKNACINKEIQND